MADALKKKKTKIEKDTENIYKERFGIAFSLPRDSDTKKKHLEKLFRQKTNFRKSSTKNEKFKDSDYYDEKMSRTQSIINEVNELELINIYNIDIKEYEDILPAFNILKMEKCSILKYGIKKSTKPIKYSYCKTCDQNLLNPICIPCINHCHKGHLIKRVFKKENIKCSCGEKIIIKKQLIIIFLTIKILYVFVMNGIKLLS